MEMGAIRTWADAVQPVFICGIERSGTSMLQLALARHPALFAVPDVYETFMFATPEAILREAAPDMAVAYLGGERQLELFRARYAVAGLGDEDLIRAFFHFAAHTVYPGQRPLEKTPSHVRQLERMFKLFPHARVIVCTRDAPAVVASYRKRMAAEQARGLPREVWGWMDRSTDALIAHCLTVGEQVRMAAVHHGAQMYVAPYDWLTADAPGALTALCAFAGLAPSDALLTPKPRQQNRVDNLLLRPIGPRSAADDKLDMQEQALVRAAAAALPPLWHTPGPLTALVDVNPAPPATA